MALETLGEPLNLSWRIDMRCLERGQGLMKRASAATRLLSVHCDVIGANDGSSEEASSRLRRLSLHWPHQVAVRTTTVQGKAQGRDRWGVPQGLVADILKSLCVVRR